MKKWLLRTGLALLLIALGIVICMLYNMRDRHPGYEVDLDIQAGKEQVPVKMGFGKQKITPQIIDTWNDANGVVPAR